MTSSSSNQVPTMAGKGIPVFTGHNFAHWKLKAKWHLAGIHEEMITTIQDGAIIPTMMIAEVKEGDNVVQEARRVPTTKNRWSDTDKLLFNLDAKAMSILGNAVSEQIFSKISGCKSAKEIWDTLIVSYEGVEVVKEQRMNNLIRNYENFYCKDKESLADLHTRFQILLNDLSSVGIEKNDFEICKKFLDVVPSRFENVITTLVVSEKLSSYKLPSLFGLLLSHEETQERKKINSRRVSKDPEAALVATSKKNKEIFYKAESDSSQSDDSDSESEGQSEVKKLKEQLALLSMKLDKKYTYKGKRPFDPKKATCYKCGEKGHIAADCKNGNAQTDQITKIADRAQKYRQKYLKYKKNSMTKDQPQKTEQKAFFAEEWLDEELSSDDEEEVVDQCLMALSEPKTEAESSSQFEKDMMEADKHCLHSDWDKSMLFKVQNFHSYTNEQKQTVFEYLHVDFKNALEEITKLESKIKNLNLIIQEKQRELSDFAECQVKLSAQCLAYSDLAKENHKLRKETLEYKNICKSWCQSSVTLGEVISKQIPKQVQAIIGEDQLKNEGDSEEVKIVFKPDILPNAFSTEIGTRTFVTNAFVKATGETSKSESSKAQTDPLCKGQSDSKMAKPNQEVKQILQNPGRPFYPQMTNQFGHVQGKFRPMTNHFSQEQDQIRQLTNQLNQLKGPSRPMTSQFSHVQGQIRPMTNQFSQMQGMSKPMINQFNHMPAKHKNKQVRPNQFQVRPSVQISHNANKSKTDASVDKLGGQLKQLTNIVQTLVSSKSPPKERPISPPKTKRLCYSCGERGHEAAKCKGKSIVKPEKGKPRSVSPKQKSTKLQGKKGQTDTQPKYVQKQNFKNTPCKYCGKVGHYSMNCMKELNKWNYEKPKSDNRKIHSD